MKRFFAKVQMNSKYFLLFVALALVIYGVTREEYLVVLKKAAYICLECIGIG
jgi:hypothetical protein